LLSKPQAALNVIGTHLHIAEARALREVQSELQERGGWCNCDGMKQRKKLCDVQLLSDSEDPSQHSLLTNPAFDRQSALGEITADFARGLSTAPANAGADLHNQEKEQLSGS
jgi:hypothetical protein